MSIVQLKPGLLVGLSTKVSGGVAYRHKDADAAEVAADMGGAVPQASAHVEAWETLKIVDDPEEHAAAVKARGKARSLITGQCIASPFGLLCPSDRADKLDAAIAEARDVTRTFNLTSKRTKVDVWVLRGQIVESDTDAARGIAAEIKGLLADMQAGIVARDADAIREAARKAKALGGMLEGAHAEKVTKSIEIARAAAREIVKTIAERGDAALILVADSKVKELREAEQAFLDLDAPEAIEGEAISPVAASAIDVEGPVANVAPVAPSEVSTLDEAPEDKGASAGA